MLLCSAISFGRVEASPPNDKFNARLNHRFVASYISAWRFVKPTVFIQVEVLAH